MRRSHDGAGLRLTVDLVAFDTFDQSKVSDLGFTVFCQQNVSGFQIAVNNAGVVREVHRPGN